MWNDPSAPNSYDRHGGYSGQHPGNGLQQAVQNFSNHLPGPPGHSSSNYGQPPSYDPSGPSLDSSYGAGPAYAPHSGAQQSQYYGQAPRAEDPRAPPSRAPSNATHGMAPSDSSYAPHAYQQQSFEPAYGQSQHHQNAPSHSQPQHRGSYRSNDRMDSGWSQQHHNDAPGGRDGRESRDRENRFGGGRGRGGKGGSDKSGPGRDSGPPNRGDGPHGKKFGGGGHQRGGEQNNNNSGPRDHGPKKNETSGAYQHQPQPQSHQAPEMDQGYPHYTGRFGRVSKDYVPLFRPYPVRTSSLDACESMHRFPDIRIPLTLRKIEKSWTKTIPIGPDSIESPPIAINTPVPLLINASAMPSPYASSAPISALTNDGATQIEVRVLLILGAPIDISAPKVGQQHHSNDKISFILLERTGEMNERSLVPPGGVFDPLLDSVSGQATSQISDEELVRAATRCVREQLSLDLSPCTKWFRFAEFEYTATSTSVNHRVIYVIPSVWELLLEGPAFESAWRAWKSEELKNGMWSDIARLRSHLKGLPPNSLTYDDLERRLKEKEAQLNVPMNLPPELSTAPERPALLLRTFSDSGLAVTATLTHLLQMTEPSTAELALVAHSFDEFLQFYFGSSIYTHLALMHAELVEGATPLKFDAVELTTRKRSHEQQLPPPESSSPTEPSIHVKQENSEPETKKIVKVEVKPEYEESHMLRPDAPSMASLDAQYQTHASSPSAAQGSLAGPASHPHQASEAIQSVPHAPGRAPPMMPQHRDYRLMQAFRYFDLNRLGFVRGEDCERILLTLGLGLSRATALDLASSGDVALRRQRNASTSGYNPTDPLRYKPICDWLKAHGFVLPSSR